MGSTPITHDLGELLQCLRAAGQEVGPFAALDALLSDFAVYGRYDTHPLPPPALNRRQALAAVESLMTHIEAQYPP